MDQKSVIVSHCLDIKRQSLDNYMILNTNFLSVDERDFVSLYTKEYSADVETFYYGGYEDAERTVAVYVPKMFCIADIAEYYGENPEEHPFSLIRIKKDKFSALTHRDYLGSLMGLGIERDTLGDIVINDDEAFVFILKSVSAYVCENLSKIGRGSVSCEIVDLSSFSQKTQETVTEFSSVASLRLDSITANAFNLSRNKAVEAVKSGLVYVNSSQILKNDYTLKEKDKIVLRGKGKVILEEIIGESKKGRIHINLKKFK